MRAMLEMKAGKAAGPTEVSVEIIAGLGRSGLVRWWSCVRVCWTEEEFRMSGR